MGFLPVNAFVIKAREPVLVDTGMGIESEEFMKALESIIDPQDLKWVWLRACAKITWQIELITVRPEVSKGSGGHSCFDTSA